ncbi:MAG: hypothetical protein P4L99_13270 [Chthoniobacter sp.]|nr:hypothetical protein [Chthoniobacter sp.]
MSDLFLKYGAHLRVVPVLHGRIAFSQLITRGLKGNSWQPDVIAVELPASIKGAVMHGLKSRGTGQFWVGRRIEEMMEVTPVSALTGYQHTWESLAATIEVLLDARRYASEKSRLRPNCPLAEWLTVQEKGFEPFVVLNRKGDFKPRYYCNVVLPDRRYHASEAYGGEREETTCRTWKIPLLGRVWYTPLFHTSETWKRAEWVQAGSQAGVPKITEVPAVAGEEDRRDSLLSQAIGYCRKHLLYVAPVDYHPPRYVIQKAKERKIRLVRVPCEAVNAAALAMVYRDEHEWSPTVHPAMRDSVMEIFSLHAGDAYVAALRFADRHRIETAWIDREIVDPVELADANARHARMPSHARDRFIEDALLSEEGLPRFYERIRHVAEASRLDTVDRKREECMAGALKSLLAAGKKVLFICGAAHWRYVKDLLEEPAAAPQPTVCEKESATLFCAGKFALLGGNEELPAFLLAYELLRRKGGELKFSLLQAGEDLELNIRRQLHMVKGTSPSGLAKLRIYLDRLCRETGVLVPRLYHLVEAAHSCLDREGIQALLRVCMKSFQCPEGMPQLSFAGFDQDGVLGNLDGQTYTLLSRRGGPSYIYDREKGVIKREERGKGGQGSGLAYVLGDWEVHMKNLMLLAKRFARPKLNVAEVMRVTDVLYGSIDPRVTARAYARGETVPYQRVSRRAVHNSLNEFEGFDPIVWVFTEDISSRLEQLVLDDKHPNLVVGVAATPRHPREQGRYQCDFQLLASWIPQFADTDEAMMKRLKRWITQGHKAYIPTAAAFQEIRSKPAWPDATPAEIVMLLARDYCRNHVIHVGEREPSQRLRDAFRAKQRRLLHVSLEHFPADDIHLLRTPTFGFRE